MNGIIILFGVIFCLMLFSWIGIKWLGMKQKRERELLRKISKLLVDLHKVRDDLKSLQDINCSLIDKSRQAE